MNAAAPLNIFLIGPMGSGKSAVGRQLAKQLHLHFYDSDVEIEARTGVNIPYIFEREGETGFREREREVIQELTQLASAVIATGGGAILLQQNRDCLSSRGIVVYLRASIQQQLERTRHGKHRPLLYTDDPETRLRDLMAHRAPLYESLAAIIVDTDGRQVRSVVDEIVQRVHSLHAGQPNSRESNGN
jgi:shikimate kinase